MLFGITFIFGCVIGIVILRLIVLLCIGIGEAMQETGDWLETARASSIIAICLYIGMPIAILYADHDLWLLRCEFIFGLALTIKIHSSLYNSENAKDAKRKEATTKLMDDVYGDGVYAARMIIWDRSVFEYYKRLLTGTLPK